MTNRLGTFDAFRDVTAWNDETARKWIDALNLRATARDQRALLSLLLERASLAPGDTVVEIGCGPGALLCELARIVGRQGRAVGFEPQPRLAEAARQRAATAGLEEIAAVESATAEELPIERDAVAACVAQTVLIHLPDDVLRRVLMEIVRAVGLEAVAVHTLVHGDTVAASYLFEMAEKIAGAAMDVGVIAVDEGRTWLDQLRRSTAQGDFFSSINFYVAVGIRGPR